jgi:hypothetical protein
MSKKSAPQRPTSRSAHQYLNCPADPATQASQNFVGSRNLGATINPQIEGATI